MKYILIGVGVFITYSYYKLIRSGVSLAYLDTILNNNENLHTDLIVEYSINVPKQICSDNLSNECIICLDDIKKII